MRFFDGLSPTLHIAHRGGAALYPENTLYAFRRAARDHATDLIETDVHLSADGVVVVAHDPTLERCTDGRGAIADTPWDALWRLDAARERRAPPGHATGIPGLAEVFDALPAMRWNIDLKPDQPALVPAFVEVVRAAGAVDRVCCGSEHDAIAAALYDALPEATHFMPRDALIAWVTAVHTGGARPADPRWRVIDMPYAWQGMTLVTPALLQAAADDGLWVNVWTVDDAPTMRTLVDMGVGGIMTDRPDLLRTVLDEAPRQA
ncbi:MAG: glycerophosphodiester phosphodiesterase [Myxococcales bacterium]|nr:glycerophosphodiester phosphodiesterase [Myxococcales bacterium]